MPCKCVAPLLCVVLLIACEDDNVGTPPVVPSAALPGMAENELLGAWHNARVDPLIFSPDGGMEAREADAMRSGTWRAKEHSLEVDGAAAHTLLASYAYAHDGCASESQLSLRAGYVIQAERLIVMPLLPSAEGETYETTLQVGCLRDDDAREDDHAITFRLAFGLAPNIVVLITLSDGRLLDMSLGLIAHTSDSALQLSVFGSEGSRVIALGVFDGLYAVTGDVFARR